MERAHRLLFRIACLLVGVFGLLSIPGRLLAQTLPNEHGQVWQEYDIREYTRRFPGDVRPEQRVVDWILRDTGTELWFSEPVGLLSASRDKLRVYHTSEVQTSVADVVQRFTSRSSGTHVFGMRLVMLSSPNWRSKLHRVLEPLEVKTPGVEAWTVSKEQAAFLVSELRKRTDCVELVSPNVIVENGQDHLIERTRPITYVRAVRDQASGRGSGFDMAQFKEGFVLQISPLLSSDGQTADAVVKCDVNQIERFSQVPIDVATLANSRQVAQIQVPQLSSWHLHERFQWPADQALLISRGVVPTPSSNGTKNSITKAFLPRGPGRGEALLLLEYQGRDVRTVTAQEPSVRTSNLDYRGRY